MSDPLDELKRLKALDQRRPGSLREDLARLERLIQENTAELRILRAEIEQRRKKAT